MSPPTFDETAFVLAPAAGCSWLGGELVVLDPAGQVLRGINARGAQVLAQLDGRRTVKQLAVSLDAADEVRGFVSKLLSARLLVPATGPTTPAISAPVAPAPMGAPELVWEQRFVGLQELSDPCMQQPPPGYCGNSTRFGDFSGGATGP